MSYKNQSEIDLAKILRAVVKYKKSFLAVVVLFVASSAAVSFVIPKKYKSEITLSLASPAFENASKKNFSGIASLVGIGGIAQSDSSTIYMAKLKSRFIKQQFIESNSLLPLLYSDNWDKSEKSWISDSVPKMWEAVRFFDKEVLNIRTDKETGLVSLSITWYDAEIAKQWADAFVVLANATLKKEFDEKKGKNLEFLKEQLTNTSNVAVRNSLNSLIEEELKKAMLSHGSDEFAFNTIDPAVIPSKPFYPKKVIFILIGLILGIIVGAGLALYVDKRVAQ